MMKGWEFVPDKILFENVFLQFVPDEILFKNVFNSSCLMKFCSRTLSCRGWRDVYWCDDGRVGVHTR